MHIHLTDAIHRTHPYLLQSLGLRATGTEGAVVIAVVIGVLILAGLGAAFRSSRRPSR